MTLIATKHIKVHTASGPVVLKPGDEVKGLPEKDVDELMGMGALKDADAANAAEEKASQAQKEAEAAFAESRARATAKPPQAEQEKAPKTPKAQKA